MATELPLVKVTPGKPYGFFTDTSVCIGCKACEVACKEWNQLPSDDKGFLGESLDNTGELGGATWRHVKFIDNVPDETMGTGDGKAFLLMSDVCKHCKLCYDRLQGGMEPACAKACPTESIQFGPLDELKGRARKRRADLHEQGLAEANLYGDTDEVYGGLNAFFLLMDKPETYGLPNKENAVLPQRNNLGGYLGVVATAVLGLLGAVIARRQRNQEAGAQQGEQQE